jgi:hypothetical protein
MFGVKLPVDRSHFFFSFELSCPARPLKRRLGGLSGLALGLSKLALAVRAFTVENGRAWSCVTHRAAITDRAEIGHINALRGEVTGEASACPGNPTRPHGLLRRQPEHRREAESARPGLRISALSAAAQPHHLHHRKYQQRESRLRPVQS